MTRNDVQHYLSPAEVAEAHGISERTIRRWIAEGRVPAYRIGKRRIGIKPEDSNALAEPIPTVSTDTQAS